MPHGELLCYVFTIYEVGKDLYETLLRYLGGRERAGEVLLIRRLWNAVGKWMGVAQNHRFA